MQRNAITILGILASNNVYGEGWTDTGSGRTDSTVLVLQIAAVKTKYFKQAIAFL